MNEINNITKEEIRKKFIGYLGYLISSSLGLIIEPTAYGPLRLLNATEKLLTILDELDINDEEMKELLCSIVDQKEEVRRSESNLTKFLEGASNILVNKLM